MRRIAHLSDLHYVPGQTRKRDWVRSLRDLRPDAVVITGDTLVSEAKRILSENKLHALPVVDEGGRLVGMLSLNDLFRWTDDATAGATSSDAIHLVRTVATLGSSRHPRTVAAKPATVAAPGRGITQRSPGAASATVPHAAAQTTAV